MAIERLNEHMHVVGHHAPGQESIALRVEVQKGTLDEVSHAVNPKVTRAVAGIDETFDLTV